MSDIVIYRSIGSRSFSALWMLEELGQPYSSDLRDLKNGEPRSPAYLKLNPDGFVPMINDDGVIVTECPAICLYLADKYGYGDLAPRIEDPRRGPYLKWLVYATAQLEPARATRNLTPDAYAKGWGPGWRPLPHVLETIAGALTGDYLLGDRFSAADVMIGSTLAMSSVAGEIGPHPVLDPYIARLRSRPACQRAVDLNWPPEVFGRR